MTRPATFSCAWCGREKPLARTGRPPKFCSDYCRRQPATAPEQLRSAQWRLEAAQRDVKRLTEALARFRDAGTAQTSSGSAIDAETRPARFEVVNL